MECIKCICTMVVSYLKSLFKLFVAVIRIFMFISYNYFISPLLFPSPEFIANEIDSKEYDDKDSRVYN